MENKDKNVLDLKQSLRFAEIVFGGRNIYTTECPKENFEKVLGYYNDKYGDKNGEIRHVCDNIDGLVLSRVIEKFYNDPSVVFPVKLIVSSVEKNDELYLLSHSEPFILFKDKIVGVGHASLITAIAMSNNIKCIIPFDGDDCAFQTDKKSCHALSMIVLSRITKERMNSFYAKVEDNYKENDVEILKFCQSRKYLKAVLGEVWGSKMVKSKKLNPVGDNMVSLKEYVEKNRSYDEDDINEVVASKISNPNKAQKFYDVVDDGLVVIPEEGMATNISGWNLSNLSDICSKNNNLNH
jgi:hypothetical protein